LATGEAFYPEPETKDKIVRNYIESQESIHSEKFTDFELTRTSIGDKEHVQNIIRTAMTNNRKMTVKQASILTKNIQFEENRILFAKNIGPFLINKDFASLLNLLNNFNTQQSKLIMLREILPYYDIFQEDHIQQVLDQFNDSYKEEINDLVQSNRFKQ
jgi:hypothetical protein